MSMNLRVVYCVDVLVVVLGWCFCVGCFFVLWYLVFWFGLFVVCFWVVSLGWRLVGGFVGGVGC